MKKRIEQQLVEIENQHQVNILYACESGSRAWGFESTDSDWDIRFLYMHPRDWYLSVDLETKRDVIELPIKDDLDFSGWDLRKALRLYYKLIRRSLSGCIRQLFTVTKPVWPTVCAGCLDGFIRPDPAITTICTWERGIIGNIFGVKPYG